MKLLLAEDDTCSREALEVLCRDWGYDAIGVNNGRAALECLLRTEAPPLALLDWTMPIMEGPEVCKLVRAYAKSPRPYLILLTGRADEHDLVMGLESGADEYLVKPVTPGELQARLQAARRVVELQDMLARRIIELEIALGSIKQLQGLLPICMYCKKVRDDGNYWQQVEAYISARSGAQFSHGVCPDCYDNILKPELDEFLESPPAASIAAPKLPTSVF